jgi:hypothetical protein
LRFLEQLRDRLCKTAEKLTSNAGVPASGRGHWRELDEHAFHERLAVEFGVLALRGRLAACDACIALVRERRAARLRRKESIHARVRRGA